VAHPATRDTHLEREHVAELTSVRRAELRARTKGVLEAVHADEGKRVRAGEVLFEVSSRAAVRELAVARAGVQQAEAELRSATIEQESSQLLFDKGVVSKTELSLARAKTEAARAKLAEAKAVADRSALEVELASVKAPFDGTIGRIPKRAGSALAEDELLTTLTDASEVFAYFRVPEREHLAYASLPDEARPKEVGLRLADGSLYPHRGTVDALDPEVNGETGTVTLRARFANPTGLLRHGSSGKVVVRTELRGALLVPQAATFETQGELFVYALDEADTARARRVVARARVGTDFVVESGLLASDRFVTEGAQKLREGARVRPVASAGGEP
jgi:RND family efflux transporter MFP subunit